MPKALFNIQPLLATLAQGTTLLTPNNRLRNQIRLAYNQSFKEKIVRVPAIYSLDEWISTQWQTLSYQARQNTNVITLNEIQLETIWLEILTHSDFADPSANFSVFAGQLIQAYRYLELWNIPHTELIAGSLSNGELNDAEKLRLWFGLFDEQIAKLSAITNERRQKILIDAYQSQYLQQVPAICLQGFDDLPPLTDMLINAATSIKIEPKDKPHSKPSAYRVQCATLFEEAKTAALWTEEIVTHNPDATIGIIVPNLGKERQTIERAFIEVLEPHYLDPKTPRYTLPFNISAGTPLATTAIIKETLLLLRLGDNELPLNDWIRILNSPFFGDLDNEYTVRGKLLDYVRNQRSFSIRGAAVREYAQFLAEKTQDEITTNFSKNLQQIADFQRQNSGSADADTWIQRIRSQLKLVHWPGARTLDSVEYQQITQWFQLLEQLACLNFRAKPLARQDILKTLSLLASKTHFQAEVKSSPIYILGSLEGAGLEFDYCWIMGMNNQDWPPRPTPNPLLPLTLQRRYQLPRASLERETRYAKSITQQLLQCAPQIIVSYGNQENETDCLPSALIEHLPENSVDQVIATSCTLLSSYSDSLMSAELEWINCESGPALNPVTLTSGGSDLLKQQALCPFNSFARYRLHAKPFDKPCLGLSPIDKGNIIHNALELIWDNLKNSEGLCAKNENELSTLVNKSIEQVFTFKLKRNIKELGDYYYHIEQQRFCQLLLRWLTLEKDRSPFKILALEKELNSEFAGLSFKLRIDRVDQLENGEILLIDYKSGNVNPKKLCGSRIEEPQLPLYLLCYPDSATGIAFAKVNNKDPGYVGIGNLADNQGLKLKSTQSAMKVEHWTDAVDFFRNELEHLSLEFSEGHCKVKFKNKEAERYAGDFSPLNRVEEQNYIRYRLKHDKPSGNASGDLSREDDR